MRPLVQPILALGLNSMTLSLTLSGQYYANTKELGASNEGELGESRHHSLRKCALKRAKF